MEISTVFGSRRIQHWETTTFAKKDKNHLHLILKKFMPKLLSYYLANRNGQNSMHF